MLFCACMLLLGTALSAVRQVADGARAEMESLLRQSTAGGAARVSDQLGASERLTLLLAQNPDIQERYPDRQRLATALSGAGPSTGDTIISSALIDAIGRVYVQVVDGVPVDAGMRRRRAQEWALLEPTLNLPVGVARQTKPYYSKHVGRWVIATTTVISPGADARPRILMTLSDLSSVQRSITVDDSRVLSRVIDPSGVVIANGRSTSTETTAPGADAERATLLDVRSQPTVQVRNGQAYRAQAIEVSPANDNAWWIVTSMPAPGSGSLLRSGSAATAMAVATLLMLVLGLLTLRRHRETLSIANISDPLTGLLNRGALAERGEEVLASGEREGYQTAVLCLNLANFRDVNDALGHATGDAVMREVSRRLHGAIQGGDLLIRLGGDEFAILLSKVTDRTGALDAARKILATLYPTIIGNGHAVGIHATMGVALAPEDGETVDVLVERAGRAMYAARRAGVDLRYFEAAMAPQPSDRLDLVADLRMAIDTDQLQLEYQPKVNLRTGHIEGVEAFLRWHHPRHGRLFPGAFLPLAEQTGLIGPITARTITLSLAQTRAWLDEGLELPVSVNLSGRCMHDLSTIDVVARGLTRWQVPPRLLKLEIAHSAMASDDETAGEVLRGLDALGIELVVDDYGSGFSSLADTDALIRELKLDGRLLKQAQSGHDGADLVRSAIDLGHQMGLRLVAESVEDPAAVRALVGLGCDMAQGNFFCAPMEPQALRAWLLERNRSAPSSLQFDGSKQTVR